MHLISALISVALAVPGVRVFHRPSAELVAAWTKTLFDQDTVWVFRDEADFQSVMDEGALAPDLRTELRALAQPQLRGQAFNFANNFFEVPRDARVFVMAPNSVWDRLPPRFLRAVYRHQFEREWGDGSVLRFRPRRGLTTPLVVRLLPYATGPRAARALARLAFRRGDDWLVPVVAATWRYLSKPARALQVDTFLNDIPQRYGIQPDVPVALPPFLRVRVGTYSPRPANCFNLAVNLLRAADTPEDYTDCFALERHLAAEYRVVNETEPRRPGDLMVYREPVVERPRLIPYNVSVITADGLIATKNGLNKFTPYVLEDEAVDRASNDHAAAPYTLTTYRHVDPDAYGRACERDL